ncbi:MAG: cadherin-like beta sandwich domain-containing protein [Roseburia sp.]
MRTGIRKKIGLFLLVLCACLGWMGGNQHVLAASGSLSVSASDKSVNIGDTVTITAKAVGPSKEQAVATMTLSFDSGVLEFQSCSSSVYGGGGNTVTVTGDSFTVTLKAVSAGKSKISLSGSDGVIFSTAEELDSMSGDSVSVTVENAASEGGNSGGEGGNSENSGDGGSNGNSGSNENSGNADNSSGNGTGEGNGETVSATKSADNSLRSLTLSAGTLSPAFQYNVVNYTATVSNDVTSIVVSAVTSNAAATVESVTGNTDLVVGQNAVKIVVKAENGVTATYTITVTREAAAAAVETPANSETPEQPEASETENSQTSEESIVVNNVSYNISGNFAEESIPADFSETTVNYHDAQYRGLVFDHGTQILLYLVPQENTEESGNAEAASHAAGKFFVYDETRDFFYSFVKLTGGAGYTIALYAPLDAEIPDTYVQVPVSVGEDVLNAYQVNGDTEFCLFYGMNQDGTERWYQYDCQEGTYQRVNTALSISADTETAEETNDDSMAYLQREYNNLSETYAKEKAFSRNTMAILIFIIAILVIVMINMLLHGTKGGGSGEKRKKETPRVTPEKKNASETKPEKKDGLLHKLATRDDRDKLEETDEETEKHTFFKRKPFEEPEDTEELEDEIEDDFGEDLEDSGESRKKDKEKKKDSIDIIDFNDF